MGRTGSVNILRINPSQLRFTSLVVVLLVLVLMLLPGCGTGGTLPQTAPDKEQEVQEQPVTRDPVQTQELLAAPSQSTIHTVQATVTSITDGDTIRVRLDGRDEKVRLRRYRPTTGSTSRAGRRPSSRAIAHAKFATRRGSICLS